MDPILLAVWIYLAALMGLNLLDWFTTMVLMVHFRDLGPEERVMPLWKATRPGRWLRRRRGFRWIKPPEVGPCYWYDHELNPWFRWGLKRVGVHMLSVGKLVPLLVITWAVVKAISYAPSGGYLTLLVALMFLTFVYVWVVINNTLVILRCLSAQTVDEH